MKSKKSSSLKKKAAVWPQKRNVLFRPDRSSYVRKDKRGDECPFCIAATNPESFETLCLHKTQFSMVMLNKYPYNSGHLLILPQRHCGDLLALSNEEYDDLHRTLRTSLACTELIYQPAAMNLGMNHGKAAGAGLPDHLHYHLIPRWKGDLNFFPLIAETKLVVETLEQTYEKYFKLMKKTFKELK